MDYLQVPLIKIIYFQSIKRFRDSPGESNHVSISELREIQSGKVIDGRKRHNRVKVSKVKKIAAFSVDTNYRALGCRN